MSTDSILARIRCPGDLKHLSSREITQLAAEIRSRIVTVVSRNGGHLASNLGVVELAIAIHRVFHSPDDKIVWDVGHQCYAHKLLTGRDESFETLRLEGGLSGFPKRSESPHDVFDTGHSSTSISAALGLLAADRLSANGHPDQEHVAIAVIGDGALTGGMAYEALAHAGQLGLPLIVVLNDNKMSIGPNVGALSKYLSRLTMKSRYQKFRRWFDSLVQKIPWIGPRFFNLIVRMKRGLKALFFVENFFVDLGFEYVGPIQGHSIQSLERVLVDVQRLKRPVVVHVLTRKGKGYGAAEEDPSRFHGVSSFSVRDGSLKAQSAPGFTDAFAKALLTLGREEPRLVAITAAMEKGTGLSSFHSQYPDRFFDVGIAEQHALTFAAGLAAGGLRPVVALYSTFAQRAVDQLIHDIALQNLPVILCLDRAGFVGDDGETHQGLFDIALFNSIPHLDILAPASSVELELMLRHAIALGHPTVIRYPKAACPAELPAFSSPIEQGRGTFVKKDRAPILVAYTGSLHGEVFAASGSLERAGIAVDLYNLRFLKPLDEGYLIPLFHEYQAVVVIEEGMRSGGIGDQIAALFKRHGCETPLLCLGAPELFPDQGSRAQLLARYQLDDRALARAIAHFYRSERNGRIAG